MIEPAALVAELLAQHRYLVLDQRDGATGAMGDMQFGQHLGVMHEEVGMPEQVTGDGLFVVVVGTFRLAACHSSMAPSKTRDAGPVMVTLAPAPGQCITRSPPGSVTRTRSSRSP